MRDSHNTIYSLIFQDQCVHVVYEGEKMLSKREAKVATPGFDQFYFLAIIHMYSVISVWYQCNFKEDELQ